MILSSRWCAGLAAMALVLAAGKAHAAQPMNFYGVSLGASGTQCGVSHPRTVLTVIGRAAGTGWSATRLDTGASIGSGTIGTAYGTAQLTNVPAAPIAVSTTDVAYALLDETCANSSGAASGALVYPADDGASTVGSRVVMYSPYASSDAFGANFVAAVSGATTTATISTPSGTVVAGPQTIAGNGAWVPTGLAANTVYVVTSTGGDITVGSASINAYALLPAADSRAASCQNDVTQHAFGAILPYDSGSGLATGVAVFNDGAADATVTLTQLTGGNATYTLTAFAGASTYSSTLYAAGVYRFDSTQPVSVWAGSPEGPNTIANLGEDVAIAMPSYAGGTWRLRSYAQSTSTVFAPQGAVVTVNGASSTVGARQSVSVAAGQDVVVTSTAPFLYEAVNSNSFDDWGKFLRPLPPVDSDSDTVPDTTEAPGGSCQSTAPDSDSDGLDDFLDVDSDNDCLLDSDPSETGAARTNPALPPGPHCPASAPFCVVLSGATQGTCLGCNGDYGSGQSRACTSASAPMCQSNGSCAPCAANYGSGQANACKSASAPVCSGGACVGCNGDYGSGASAACPDVVTPFCQAGQCVACGGGYGSGQPQACSVPTTPVCTSIGACLGCSNGYGTGVSLACEVASTPVCVMNGANAGACVVCNGDNGSGVTQPCQTSASPYCTASGTCGKCATNADCAGRPNAPICNPATGGCGQTCFGDADCNATQWCAAGVCSGKTPNGQPLPNVTPVNGQCTPANGARVCVSGLCSATDDTCGLKAGAPCSAPDGGADGGDAGAAANAECQSGVCAPNGTCGSCKTDLDCGSPTSGKVCADDSKTCVAGCRGTGGNGCPPSDVCSSTTSAVGTCAPPDAGADAGKDAASDAAPSDAGFDATTANDAAPEDAGGAGPAPEASTNDDQGGVFEGGGISCSASGHAGDASALGGVFAALAVLGAARRKRRR